MSNKVIESWKWVVGYEGRYEVSDCGRVRSWVPWNGNPLPRVMAVMEDEGRYTQLDLRDESCVRHRMIVHQMVLTAFVGPRPEGMQAAHNDDDKRNNRLGNLAWKTRPENAKDRSLNGRTAIGERHGSYKHGMYVGPNRKRAVRGAPRKKYIHPSCKRGHPFPLTYEPGRKRRCYEPECKEARRNNALGR